MIQGNSFVFSPSYRLQRHTLYWTLHILFFSYLFRIPEAPLINILILSTIWVPAFILYGYPIAYYLIPNYLLKERINSFIIVTAIWILAGYFYNYLYRKYVLFEIADFIHQDLVGRNPWAAASYLTMNVMAGLTCMIVMFKHWMQKQQDLMDARNEQVKAELQLLKGQVHPHFLFNTLNNIYAFSLEGSPKTPFLITKLSALLSYMLYECRDHLVPLINEIEIMKSYIDLEKERYGSRIDISVNVTGDLSNHMIAPLLLLPFLENAFKHGTSGNIDESWMAMDINMENGRLWFKLVNSKDVQQTGNGRGGIGIQNVKKRLALLYPGNHDLSLQDEGDFFAVALSLQLDPDSLHPVFHSPINITRHDTVPDRG